MQDGWCSSLSGTESGCRVQDRRCREVGVPDTSIPTIYHLPSDWMQDGWCSSLSGCRMDGAGCSSLLGTESGCRMDGAAAYQVQDGRCRMDGAAAYQVQNQGAGWMVQQLIRYRIRMQDIWCREVGVPDLLDTYHLTPRYLPPTTYHQTSTT